MTIFFYILTCLLESENELLFENVGNVFFSKFHLLKFYAMNQITVNSLNNAPENLI